MLRYGSQTNEVMCVVTLSINKWRANKSAVSAAYRSLKIFKVNGRLKKTAERTLNAYGKPDLK
jgi:hypothetical protein